MRVFSGFNCSSTCKLLLLLVLVCSATSFISKNRESLPLFSANQILRGMQHAPARSSIDFRIRSYRSSIIRNSAIHRSTSRCSTLQAALNAQSASTTASSPTLTKIKSLFALGTNLFPFWVLLASVLGFKFPSLFLGFAPYVTAALTLTMTAMGMTLSVQDFRNVLGSWRFVLLGFIAQYTIMPLSAAAASKVFQLSPDIASGLILVGCAPGGTASNLVALIAGADVALSVLMTAASTVAAVVVTPFLVTRLAGSHCVSVKAADLVASTLSVVLLPVLSGLALNTRFPVVCTAASAFTPFLSVLLVALICGAISAQNSSLVAAGSGLLSWQLAAAVISLHVMGFCVGYAFARLLGAEETKARTISIETGMQNSALAVVLARHFPNPLLSALPGALSATCHSIIGSLLAALWRRYPATTTSSSSTGNATTSTGTGNTTTAPAAKE